MNSECEQGKEGANNSHGSHAIPKAAETISGSLVREATNRGVAMVARPLPRADTVPAAHSFQNRVPSVPGLSLDSKLQTKCGVRPNLTQSSLVSMNAQRYAKAQDLLNTISIRLSALRALKASCDRTTPQARLVGAGDPAPILRIGRHEHPAP